MKTGLLRRNAFFILLSSFLLSAAFIACSKDDNDNNTTTTYTTSGNASGSQQNPPVTTTGTGTLTGNYNAETNNWQYTINWSALTSAATLVEVHGPASVGVNGNLLLSLTITTPGINGSATGNVTLTPQQEQYLVSNETYYTILTATNVTGEIRGQITATPQ
jgi:hypothetical protein